MKRVRMLLRVSSNQQLEADGDLSVQREIVKEYIAKFEDWELDSKEYFEGSNSGYKNSVEDRDVLQEALQDAQNKEYDILVAYKDDRIGRRMFEICLYVMSLKQYNVDIYTVKDGLITPDINDVMGQMMLALRYGNAQKSSSDTGMRVKDTAQKLVKQGKFMGGSAPYGYKFELSGEISKHGRALHKLVIVPEQAEVVRYIYDLSLNKEFGSSKIARTLNLHEKYKDLAPRDVWKGGTITSILTNPIYAGHVAYKRRENVDGTLHRLDSSEWIKSNEPNENIRIIDGDIWDRTQEKRKMRSDKYIKSIENDDARVIIRRNDGMLPLIDVIYCGYCGRKLTNGSKYNYWTIKSTGERRKSKSPLYRCQTAQSGVPHNKVKQFKAEDVEKLVFECLSEHIGHLQKNQDIFSQIEENQNKERKAIESEIKKEQKELDKIMKKIDIMENHIPDAMTGDYELSLKELTDLIRKQKAQADEQRSKIKQKETLKAQTNVTRKDWKELKEQIPTWQQIFKEADGQTKRVLVNKLIERIDVTADQIVVRFKINLSDFLIQPRMTSDSDTIP